MLQVDDLFKVVTEVHKEYNASLPVEQQDKDEVWFDEIDASMLQFKQKIHGWIRDTERERDAVMEAKSSVSGKGQVFLEVCHQKGQANIQVCHH